MRLRGELIEEEDENEDWPPEAINTCMFMNDGSDRFYVTAKGQFSGYDYICDQEKERPLRAVELQKGFDCTFMRLSPKNDFLIAGCKNGEIFIWSMDSDKKVL